MTGETWKIVATECLHESNRHVEHISIETDTRVIVGVGGGLVRDDARFVVEAPAMYKVLWTIMHPPEKYDELNFDRVAEMAKPILARIEGDNATP